MNRFRRFLGIISIETCKKWINLAVNPTKNRQALGAILVYLMTGVCARPTPIEYFRLMQCLAIWGQNETYVI